MFQRRNSKRCFRRWSGRSLLATIESLFECLCCDAEAEARVFIPNRLPGAPVSDPAGCLWPMTTSRAGGWRPHRSVQGRKAQIDSGNSFPEPGGGRARHSARAVGNNPQAAVGIRGAQRTDAPYLAGRFKVPMRFHSLGLEALHVPEGSDEDYHHPLRSSQLAKRNPLS
jgi:hypothetical protein